MVNAVADKISPILKIFLDNAAEHSDGDLRRGRANSRPAWHSMCENITQRPLWALASHWADVRMYRRAIKGLGVFTTVEASMCIEVRMDLRHWLQVDVKRLPPHEVLIAEYVSFDLISPLSLVRTEELHVLGHSNHSEIESYRSVTAVTSDKQRGPLPFLKTQPNHQHEVCSIAHTAIRQANDQPIIEFIYRQCHTIRQRAEFHTIPPGSQFQRKARNSRIHLRVSHYSGFIGSGLSPQPRNCYVVSGPQPASGASLVHCPSTKGQLAGLCGRIQQTESVGIRNLALGSHRQSQQRHRHHFHYIRLHSEESLSAHIQQTRYVQLGWDDRLTQTFD